MATRRASDRTYEIEEILIRPGTYFNPQTEVLLVVDDSADLDNEIFNMEEFEGADWVLISDDAPVDESKRDEQLEEFQQHYHGGDGRGPKLDDGDDPGDDEDEDDDEEDELDEEEDADDGGDGDLDKLE